VLGTTTVSTHAVVITLLSDWITFILTNYFQVLVIVASNTLGEVLLILVWQCSNLWLPIGIFCGAECGCEYTSSSLLLIWTNGRIYQLYSPNWLPNSMPLSLFWTIGIPTSYACDWSINALASFCNSTCLVIHVLMWKGTKGQSMIECPSSSQNADSWK
jgi:hypothetical protein